MQLKHQFYGRTDVSNDRKKAEHDRLHRQDLRITGFEPSLYKKSEWCLKYVNEQCFKAASLSKGPSSMYPYTDVSKEDMFQAQELIQDAQRALDNPLTHPELGLEWVAEHKSQAYRIIKDARDGVRLAGDEVEKMHISSIEELIEQAWNLYNGLNHDSRLSETKPRDVFEKLRQAQTLTGKSYLKKVNRDDLRDKVDRLWKLVQEFIGESQRQYEERQRARAARDAERAEKQREWRERQEEHLARWQSRIDNGDAFIDRLKGQIEELEEKRDGARTSEFAERVQGWIDEKQEKIAEVRAELNELRNRISDVQRRLNGSQT